MLIRLALKFQERMRPSKAIEPDPGEKTRTGIPPTTESHALLAVPFL
jgi:hypothetical protein